MGYVDVLMSGSSVTALRAVRVLRPLRTITHIKGLRVGGHTSAVSAGEMLQCPAADDHKRSCRKSAAAAAAAAAAAK
jgi:hypothetical protein